MGKFTAQWMPEKSKFMASIIFCKMGPGIRKLYRSPALVKSPGMSGDFGIPAAQAPYYAAGYSRLFAQFSDGGGFCGFAWLYAALDQLETGEGVFEGQDFQSLSFSQYDGASLGDDH